MFLMSFFQPGHRLTWAGDALGRVICGWLQRCSVATNRWQLLRFKGYFLIVNVRSQGAFCFQLLIQRIDNKTDATIAAI